MPKTNPITIPGRGDFPSYSAAGRALGVTAQAIREAKRNNRLDSIGKKSRYAFERDGVEYKSMSEASRILKIPYAVIWAEQVKKNGGLMRTPSRQNQIYVLGKTWLSLISLSRHLGVKYHYVRVAWKQGKLKHYLETPVTYEGKQYHCIHEAAQVNNKNWHYVEKRIE